MTDLEKLVEECCDGPLYKFVNDDIPREEAARAIITRTLEWANDRVVIAYALSRQSGDDALTVLTGLEADLSAAADQVRRQS